MTAGAVALGRAQARIRALPGLNFLGLGAFALYFTIGTYLAFVLHAYDRDAYSRVGNAYYVLFSRDPHLGAIGFVWMPLPSLVELVLMPANTVFPALVAQGFAAVIMSTVFMALAVVTLNSILGEFRVRRAVRLAFVAVFALHPMIVYYAAIGTSEAPTIFFALMATLHLARYAMTSSTTSLVGVGIALAGGYLTRYEAAAAAFGVAGFILVTTYLRVPGTARSRLVQAAGDGAVALTPFVLVFVGWALASWIIVGSPFSQFTSEYGNSSQMRVGGGNEVDLPLGPSIILAGLRVTTLSIAWPIGLLCALWLMVVRRDARALAVLAVMGSMIAFMVLAYVLHLTAPWLRYFILVIPLSLLLLACAIPREAGPVVIAQARSRRLTTGLPAPLRSILALALAFATIPVAAVGMVNPAIASEEARDIPPLLGPAAAAPDRPGNQIQSFAGEKAIAEYLDAMNAPRGSILIDAFLGFPIIMQSRYPERFVITADRDFRPALADPVTFGVTYLLAPPGGGNQSLDAVNRTYPTLGADPGFATTVKVFPALGPSPSWTLYQLVPR
jgi:hypothetical protein